MKRAMGAGIAVSADAMTPEYRAAPCVTTLLALRGMSTSHSPEANWEFGSKEMYSAVSLLDR